MVTNIELEQLRANLELALKHWSDALQTLQEKEQEVRTAQLALEKAQSTEFELTGSD